jgi:hypothetical protein
MVLISEKVRTDAAALGSARGGASPGPRRRPIISSRRTDRPGTGGRHIVRRGRTDRPGTGGRHIIEHGRIVWFGRPRRHIVRPDRPGRTRRTGTGGTGETRRRSIGESRRPHPRWLEPRLERRRGRHAPRRRRPALDRGRQAGHGLEDTPEVTVQVACVLQRHRPGGQWRPLEQHLDLPLTPPAPPGVHLDAHVDGAHRSILWTLSCIPIPNSSSVVTRVDRAGRGPSTRTRSGTGRAQPHVASSCRSPCRHTDPGSAWIGVATKATSDRPNPTLRRIGRPERRQ